MKNKLSSAIAIAACSFLLSPDDSSNLATVQVTPAGHFTPADGRPMKVASWYIDQAVASRVIARFNAAKLPVVVDYEHQTLHKEDNGQPAPAAAWYKSLEWREGEGLFATIELTARAKQAIKDGEYKYFSPVFSFDARTGEVLRIDMGAITNTPAIHGMDALALRAAACFGFTHEDGSMNKLLAAVISCLALTNVPTEDEAVAALTAHFLKDPLDPLRQALGVDGKADQATLVAACTALKKGQANPDPTKYVPIEAVNGLQTRITALTAKLGQRDQQELDEEIKGALEDGRLLPALESWARDLGKTDRVALTGFLAKTQPIAALSATQTGGRPPVLDLATGLTDVEMAVCKNLGLSHEEFKKSKAALAAS